MQRIFLALVLSALTCALGLATDAPVLPNQFGSWQAENPARILQPRDLGSGWAKWPNGERVLKEAGLTRIEQRAFHSGVDEITVRTYVLRDPSSAFEVYTFLLAPGMRDLGIGKDSAGTDYEANFLIGNLVVQANIPPTVKSDSLRDLFMQLQTTADSSPLPPLKSYLPERWRTFGSEKYALGPEAFRAAIASWRAAIRQVYSSVFAR